MNHKRAVVFLKFSCPYEVGRGYPKPRKNHGFSVENGCHKILVSFHLSGDFPLSLQLLEFLF